MKKQELIAQIAAEIGIKQGAVENVLDCLGILAQSALANGDEVTLPGIGKLSVKAKSARTGRNPKTGETMEIPAKNVPHFTAAKALKDAVSVPHH
ncbi:MAG: HU family DNA-binding protein [Nitrosomonadales bacterium]|nr:HU family DNA-binding protein [Nitrosomonadales bacterium]